MVVLLPRGSRARVEPSFADTRSREQERNCLASVLQAITHLARQTWHRNKTLLRRMLELSMISNAVAVLCAVVYGVANPFLHSFAGDAETRMKVAQRTATLVVFYFTLSSICSTSVLYAFFLRGRLLRPSQHRANTSDPLSLASSLWTTICLTWKGALVLVCLPPAVTAGLFAVGFPVLRYNAHTFVSVLFLAIHSVIAISRVVQFRQKHTSSVASPSAGPSRRSQPRHKLRKSLWLGLLNVFPTLLAATAGMEFMAVGKRLDVTDSAAVGGFVTASLLAKFLFQLTGKVLSLKASPVDANTRNRLYPITSMNLILEISLRIAMIRLAGPENTTSLYVGTVLAGVLETVVRGLAVLIDQLVIERKRRWFQKKTGERVGGENQSRLLTVPSIQTAQVVPMGLVDNLQQVTVAQRDGEFEAWKTTHLRLSAVEVMAETMAEYCGIGFACVYMISLRDNPAFDLGLEDNPANTPTLYFATTQLTTYAVQMAVEIVSDLAGRFFESRMGIHVDEVFATEELEYIRWTVFALAIQAGGLTISGLITAGSRGDA